MIKEGYADILKDNVKKSAASLDTGCCCIFILLTIDCQKAIHFFIISVHLYTTFSQLNTHSIILVLVIFMENPKGFVRLYQRV